jgi:hypothetical protein
MAGIETVLLEDQIHLQVEQLGLGEHVPGNAEHAMGGAEVQATAEKVSPSGCIFVRSIHGLALSIAGE